MPAISNTKENFAKCICDDCPTYQASACTKEKKLYCAIGQSNCDLARKGCICGSCPLWSEYKLTNYYFCLTGKAI